MIANQNATAVTPKNANAATRWNLDKIHALDFAEHLQHRQEILRYNLKATVAIAAHKRPRPQRLNAELYRWLKAFGVIDEAADLDGAITELAVEGVVKLVKVRSDVALTRGETKLFVRRKFGDGPTPIRFSLRPRRAPEGEPIYEVGADLAPRGLLKVDLLAAFAEHQMVTLGPRAELFQIVERWLHRPRALYETLVNELVAEGNLRLYTTHSGGDTVAVVPDRVRNLLNHGMSVEYGPPGTPMRFREYGGKVTVTLGDENRNFVGVAA